MTFIDLFAGVGGFRRGMELAGHTCVGFCEWDKFATASYTSMHLLTEEQRKYLETLDLKKRQNEILKEEYRNGDWYADDIRGVDARNIPGADCWCFGAPCQDFSVAGNRAGLEGDRSSLVKEVFRILRETEEQDRPEWLIYENVKGMLSSNRGFDFLAILTEMDQLGYDAEWFTFNSKYHGVPQNRERVYLVGHLRTKGRRKIFSFEGTDREDNVQINTPMKVAKYPSGNEKSDIFSIEGVSRTLCASDHKQPVSVVLPVLTPDRAEKRQNGRRFKDNGEEMFTLTAQDRHGVAVGFNTEDDGSCRTIKAQYQQNNGDNFKRTGGTFAASGVAVKFDDVPAVKVREAVQKGYTEALEGDSINYSFINSNLRRGRVGHQCANTLDCKCEQGVIETIAGDPPEEHPGIYIEIEEGVSVYAVWYEKYKCYIAIRKLTPRECFRLQGWTDDYFDRAQFVNSDSQLYKQAGNGVTVNVVYEIARRL